MHSDSAIETLWHHKTIFCKRNRLITGSILQFCALLERTNGAFGALLRNLPYVTVTATPLRFYCVFMRTQSHGAYFVHAQSGRRRMAFYNVLDDPTATNEVVIAFLRRCGRLLRVPRAPWWRCRSTWVTGVLRLKRPCNRLHSMVSHVSFVCRHHDFDSTFLLVKSAKTKSHILELPT